MSWYRARNYRFRQFKTKACKNCPVRQLCTTARANGKIVQCSEFTPYIQANAARVAADPGTYKKRQALVEHPFGTIKRQRGLDQILTKKGIERAGADFGLIAIAYNLRRLLNIGLWGKKPGLALFSNFMALKSALGRLIRTIDRIIESSIGYRKIPQFQIPLKRFAYF